MKLKENENEGLEEEVEEEEDANGGRCSFESISERSQSLVLALALSVFCDERGPSCPSCFLFFVILLALLSPLSPPQFPLETVTSSSASETPPPVAFCP